MTTESNERYCPICGTPAGDGTFNRFGEWCCSEAHAGEYAAEVRAQKQRRLAGVAGPAAARSEAGRGGGCC